MLKLNFVFLFSVLAYSSSTHASPFQLGNNKCGTSPQPVPFSTMRCDEVNCKMECNEDYKFPRGERVVEVACFNGNQWGAPSYGNLMPDCETYCEGGCKNGGKCMLKNVCMCPKGFMGKNCEKRIEVCREKVPMPTNAMGKCVSVEQLVQSCKATCIEGHQFPDGSLTVDILCRNGKWVQLDNQFNRCEPQCKPKCQNGGHCISHNVCQCTKNFRGDYCQYSSDRCSPQKMNFNGLYKCQSSMTKMECQLSCPAGYGPKAPLATTYTCSYDEGMFRPQPNPPLCDYGDAQVEIKITHN